MRNKKTKISLVVVAVLGVAVALAPTLLGGYARGVIVESIASQVKGTVTLSSVSLGWFSAQKIAGLSIDGGAANGSINADAQLNQGLWELLMGGDITLALSGAVTTTIAADGSIGLLRMMQDVPAAASPPSGTSATPSAAGSPLQNALGTRAVKVELTSFDLHATRSDGVAYDIEKMKGSIALKGNDVSVTLDGSTKTLGRAGEFLLESKVALAFSTAGALDLNATHGTFTLDGSDLALPSVAGEVALTKLHVSAKKEAAGEVRVDAAINARVADAAESQVAAEILIAQLFDDGGALMLDPGAIRVSIDARAVPLAALQPFAPEIAPGVPLDFAQDIGSTADIIVSKGLGGAARVSWESQHLRLAFDGAVTADGARIDGATLQANVTIRPQTLRAISGLDAAEAVEVSLSGSNIAWHQLDAKDAANPSKAVGGDFSVQVTKPVQLRAVAENLDARVSSLTATLNKKLDDVLAHVTAASALNYGAKGTASLTLAGDVNLSTKALAAGSLDAIALLDPATVSNFSHGALAVRGTAANLKLSVNNLAMPFVVSANDSLLAHAQGHASIELAGALAVEGAATDATSPPLSAMVNDLKCELTLPSNSKPGVIDLGARIDGAVTHVVQQFTRIPASFAAPAPELLATLGLVGSIDIKGIDPSFVARLAPSAADKVGVLGVGPMTASVRNRNENGATLAEFTLDATDADVSGSVRLAKDSLALNALVLDLTLSKQALASLPLGEGIELAPGTKISVRVPTFALTQASDGWVPSGDCAATISIDALQINRAPGIMAPLKIARIDTNASYVFKEERAVAKGHANLGGNGNAGSMAFDLAWKKPAQAKLFSGAQGSLEIVEFDLAKFEPALGLAPGSYSGMLGGAGTLKITFDERDSARAQVIASFPKTQGSIELEVITQSGQRLARAKGDVSADISADAFGKLAGLGGDPTRRVTTPVRATMTIAQLDVPLDDALRPLLARASVNANGALSPLALEVITGNGTKTSVSTGALALTIKSARLADEITLQLSSANAPSAATATNQVSTTGSIDAKIVVRGAVADSTNIATQAKVANKTKVANAPATASAMRVDATIKASKFPAATFDALAATGGSIQKYLGDAIDAEISAQSLSSTGGSLAAKLSSAYASLDAPVLTVSDGFLRVTESAPLSATFALSPAVKTELLASINPIFSDIVAGSPAKFTLTNLAWPLDGDRKKFDALFTLETGEVRLSNSGVLSFLLTFAGASRADGFESYLDMLNGTVKQGRLTYRDFALRAGKTKQGTWKNSLLFAGDIDLAAKPMRANSISTVVPLSDASNWSSMAKGIFDSIGAASPELLKSLTVGVDMSGPLFDSAGKPAKLEMKMKWPDITKALSDNPGGILDAAGSIFDAIRNRNN